MRRIPSFSALRAFEAAARLESFQLAGAELHLTPSAVSHQIRALESHFGKPLFVRHNRQVELTSDGQRLLSRLSGALDVIEAACNELMPGPARQTLVLRCAPSFASKWLGPRLAAFLRARPAVNLRMFASADPVDLARMDDVDLAIVYGEAPAGAGILVLPLGDERIEPLAAPHVAREADLSCVGLGGGPALIESTVSPVRWADWFETNGIRLPRDATGPSFDRGALAVAAAEQGLGIALESTRFAEEELARGTLVPAGGPGLRAICRPLHFLCARKAQAEVPQIAAFRDWLLAEVAKSPLRLPAAGARETA